MFFSGWSSLLRVFAVGIPAYVALLLLLRVSGKRTLSKFNAFDMIVTVAFGSTLASALLSPTSTLANVIAAFALLVALQFAITWTVTRFPATEKIVKAEPRLLFLRGEFLEQAMHRERITEREVMAALRDQGHGRIQQAEAVVLETDGSFSVIANEGVETLRYVKRGS